MELLYLLRDRIYPAASDGELRAWYLNYLKEDEDGPNPD